MNYFERKSKEIKVLDSIYGYQDSKKVCSVFDSYRLKENFVKKLRFDYFEKYYHELTNKDEVSFKGDFDYSYTYERFNGFIKTGNFLNKFYGLISNYENDVYFTTSGMGGIVSVLSSFCLYNNYNIELMYEQAYFETIKILSNINYNKKNKALYVDTMAGNFDFNFVENIDKYESIIIDTTCYHPYMFEKIVETIINKGKLCVLVRSHTKLDMIGAEYSHMGSVIFVFPNKLKKWIKISDSCKHYIGVIGNCLPPEKFTIFVYNPEILKLSELRISAISKNTTILYERLKKRGYNVDIPNHKQFCVINFNNDSIDLDDLKKLLSKFSKKNRKSIPVYLAVSFGFDYIALDCYDNFKDGKFKIRIFPSDFDEEVVTFFLDKFEKFMKTIVLY